MTESAEAGDQGRMETNTMDMTITNKRRTSRAVGRWMFSAGLSVCIGSVSACDSIEVGASAGQETDPASGTGGKGDDPSGQESTSGQASTR